MDLESVRALKEELRNEASRPRSFSLRRGLARKDGGLPPGVALGVAVFKPGLDYGMAVRIITDSPAARAYAEAVRGKAGGEVDVQIVGPIRAYARQRPLRAGCSVGHPDVTAGTLGCFVRCARSGRTGIVSNNHVLANENAARPGDPILQPAAHDGGSLHDRIGTLSRFVPLETAGANRVDAALAILDENVEFDAKTPPLIGLTEALADSTVEKVGRTTGHTSGWINAIELDEVPVLYERTGTLHFDGVIEIRGNGRPFSEPGDSGSVIYTPDRMGAGLLFAGTEGDDPLTYSNSLADVLQALDTRLLPTN